MYVLTRQHSQHNSIWNKTNIIFNVKVQTWDFEINLICSFSPIYARKILKVSIDALIFSRHLNKYISICTKIENLKMLL